jgi:hypothetical protein
MKNRDRGFDTVTTSCAVVTTGTLIVDTSCVRFNVLPLVHHSSSDGIENKNKSKTRGIRHREDQSYRRFG